MSVKKKGPEFKDTPAQARIIDLMLQGKSVSVDSAPGSGKSYVVKRVASVLPANKRYLYLVFNRKTRESAKGTLPPNVDIKTGHGLALSRVHKSFRDGTKPIVNRHQLRDIADWLEIRDTAFGSALKIASLVSKTLDNFCWSADRTLSVYHAADGIIDISDAHTKERKREIARMAGALFDAAANHTSKTVPATHDVYLKLFQLQGRDLGYDGIFLDEAQDTNPVVWDFVSRQPNTQLLVVGDRFQQLNLFRGAISVMDMVPDAEHVSMNKSHRLPDDLARIANVVLERHIHTDYRIEGNGPNPVVIGSTGELEDLHLFRTNMGLLSDVVKYADDVDVVGGVNIGGMGHKVHVVGGVAELRGIINACHNLRVGRGTDHPELKWFKSWKELETHAETPEGRHLNKFVELFEGAGPGGQKSTKDLLELLDRVNDTPSDQADCVFSTVHKAKGMEADTVRLGGDFITPSSRNYSPEEAYILYVAVTRALRGLNESAQRDNILKGANYDAKNENKRGIKSRPKARVKIKSEASDAGIDPNSAPF